MTSRFAESAALDWLGSLGWRVAHGPDTSPGGEVVLAQWVRDTLLPKLISGALRVKDAERFIERLTT